MMSTHNQNLFNAPLDTLLKKPSVTIYLDGLMVLCYDKNQKRLQAGIHTDASFSCHDDQRSEREDSRKIFNPCV